MSAASARSMLPDATAWADRRVFLTGHTGFKGAWLSLWLQRMGARLSGYALAPPTDPNLFEIAGVASGMQATHGDIRDLATLTQAMQVAKPEVVIHMAAQSLVRHSYIDPVGTYATNLMGTVHVLEAVCHTPSVHSVVVVTSDKCYENREWVWGYRENEAMGGYDPYSNSKGCAELATAAYRSSFFNPAQYATHGVAVASVRAGNVIGGGDWARDRLIPDILRAFDAGEPVQIRSPNALRPWQHVLEPLCGYLVLVERLLREGTAYGEGWNFGPLLGDVQPVSYVVDKMTSLWGKDAAWSVDTTDRPHEAQCLKLDCAKAHQRLNWQPRMDIDAALTRVIEWHRAYRAGADMREITLQQISDYMDNTA
ncbi:CDP-glucose 4,6-dehydratase [Gammaproteobacteria bacterium]